MTDEESREWERLNAEIDRLSCQLNEIYAWQQHGEHLLTRPPGWNIMFRLGVWWADRPWRKK